jgi:hypothetical protein
MDDLYTKVEYQRDLASVAESRAAALGEVANGTLDGFKFLERERLCDRLVKLLKAKWSRSTLVFSALRAARQELALCCDGDEIKRLTRKVNYLKMLCAKVLDGTTKPDSVPLEVEPDPDALRWRQVHGVGYVVFEDGDWRPIEWDELCLRIRRQA